MVKKQSIKKKRISMADIISQNSAVAKYKEQEYYDLGPAFLDATGLPGPAIGHINMFLGHSDTGKTTALILSAIAAMKRGEIPVFLITEQKWAFEHAKLMGMEVDTVTDENGEFSYTGNFIFNNDFLYIEKVTDFVNGLLDKQAKGEIPYNLCFLWDSVGSIPCEMTYNGKGGIMHNARVLADKIGMGINQRISGSRRADSQYTNTMIIVNQPWVDTPDNPFQQPEIKAKGGNAIWLNSSLVFLFGNQKKAGISKIVATKGNRKVKFAVRTKISVLKNHINGLGYEDGKIIVTPHGFVPGKDATEEKKSMERYKEAQAKYWNNILGVDGSFNIQDLDGSAFGEGELINPEDVTNDQKAD